MTTLCKKIPVKVKQNNIGKTILCWVFVIWAILIIGDPVVVENGSFVWEPEMECLKGINLRVKDGQLVAVVGAVGSGKSSLLSAILGEMIKTNGKVKRKVCSSALILVGSISL